MNFKHKLLILATALLLLGGGGVAWAMTNGQATNSTAKAASGDSTLDLDNGDDNIDWSSLPTTNVTLGGESLAITEAGTYILTGTTTNGVTVETDGNVRIVFNGATIKSSSGAAITVINANNTVIDLADGTTNTVSDAATRSDQMIDGVIYSADDLIFTGTGSLNVTATYANAIVSNDDLKFTSGTYTITSADDGIRGKDSVQILGGTYTITAAQDAIKSTNDTDATKGFVYIKDGLITIKAGDDAIHAEQQATIDGGTINISTSREGIEGASVTINGGSITLYASDDGINAPGSDFVDALITINGGTVNVTVGSGDTDAIDANGDIVVTGGDITVTAPTSSFDYDGSASMTGGTITINGQQVSDIPTPTMGGGGMRR